MLSNKGKREEKEDTSENETKRIIGNKIKALRTEYAAAFWIGQNENIGKLALLLLLQLHRSTRSTDPRSPSAPPIHTRVSVAHL